MDVTQSMLPAKAWQAFSPEMYLTFWSLSLYDLYVPVERYQSEFKRKASEMKVRLALPPSLVVPRLQTSEAYECIPLSTRCTALLRPLDSLPCFPSHCGNPQVPGTSPIN